MGRKSHQLSFMQNLRILLQWIKRGRYSSREYLDVSGHKVANCWYNWSRRFCGPQRVLKSLCVKSGLFLSIQVDWALWSFMTPLHSAEVGVTFPCSGAHYCFLKRCFGNMISFLNLWTTFLGPGLTARQALLLAEYSIQPFYPSCSAPKLLKKCLALGILSSRGVRAVTWLQIASMMLKMATLGLISLNAVVSPVKWRKKLELFQNSLNAEFLEASQLTEAIFQGYFADWVGRCFMYPAGNQQYFEKNKSQAMTCCMQCEVHIFYYILCLI